MQHPDEPTSVVPARAAEDGHELYPETVERIMASVPPNTATAWRSRWRAYAAWCAAQGLAPLPCSAQQLANYFQARTRAWTPPERVQAWANVKQFDALGVDSLKAHLGSLLKVMRLERFEPPDPALAQQVIKGLARELAADPVRDHSVRQATPAVAEQIKKMVDVLDLRTAQGLRDRALLLLGYNTGRRGGDLVMLAIGDVVKALNKADPERHPLGIRVTFRVSKTNPHGLRRDDVVPVKWVGGKYCAAKAVTDWIRYLADRGYRQGPLFPRVDRHGNIGAGSASAAADRGSGAISTRTAAQIVADAAERVRRAEVEQRLAQLFPELYAELRGNGMLDEYLDEALRDGAAGLTPHEGGEDADEEHYSAHSLRRGHLTDVLDDPKADVDKVGRRAGFAPGSRHVHRYRDVGFGWDDDPAASKLAGRDESDRD